MLHFRIDELEGAGQGEAQSTRDERQARLGFFAVGKIGWGVLLVQTIGAISRESLSATGN
jgi:hypothetical protein